MARRQVDQLDAPADEKGVGADEEGVGPLAHKSCEGRIDLAAGAGVEDLDLQPHGARSRFHVSQCGLGIVALAGLTSTATRAAPGTSSRRSSSRFAANSHVKKLIPVRLPPGRARLATRPSLTGSSATRKTMGIVVVAALAANAAAVLERGDHGDLPANQIGRQRRQSIDLIFGPAVYDRHVLALDIAGLLEALAKCAQTVAYRVRRSGGRGTRSPASPAAARAPRAATRTPRRRAA